MTCILITSIGSMSAVSLTMCFAPVRSELRIVATNAEPCAAGNFLADRVVMVPPTADAAAWLDAVRKIVEEERPDLVLNGRDEELLLLGRLRDENTHSQIRYLVPPASLGPVFNDKYETSLFAAKHRLPFPDTAYSPEEIRELIDRRGLPLFAKPRLGGFGSTGVFLVCDEGDVRRAAETGLYVFQEVLPSTHLDAGVDAWARRIGIPRQWSTQSIDHEVDVLIDGHTLVLCMSAGLNDGAFNKDLRIVDEQSMRQVGEAYGDALGKLGHTGPVNMQGRLLPDGRFVPFELNARFTGTIVGKAHLGYNLVMAALRHWCRIPAESEAMAANRKLAQRAPVYFLTFDEDALNTLIKTGEWRRS